MNLRFCSPGRLLSYLIYFSLLYFSLCCWAPARGQSIDAYKPLQLGDVVPDVVINNIKHYKSQQAKISDFRGKWLILDFWATWCSPCVAMMPKIDSLQESFRENVQFLPVAHQSAQEVSNFRGRLARQKGWRIMLPEVVADTVFSQLFPHNVYPHYVWIDPNGLVKAITGSEEITESTISGIVHSDRLNLNQKNDQDRPPYNNKTTSLAEFLSTKTGQYPANYHSLATEYIEGLPGGYHIENLDDTTKPVRITFTNISPLWLFKIAHGEAKSFFGDSFLAMEVSDQESLETYADGKIAQDWYRRNGICYELILPSSLRENLWHIFRQDLQRLFPTFQAYAETRKKRSLALVRTSNQDKIKSKSGSYSETQDGLSLTIRGGTLPAFVTNLNLYNMPSSKLPLVDMSGYTDKVDMDLEANLSDIGSLNIALARYDLRFVEKETELKILVIKDKPVVNAGK